MTVVDLMAIGTPSLFCSPDVCIALCISPITWKQKYVIRPASQLSGKFAMSVISVWIILCLCSLMHLKKIFGSRLYLVFTLRKLALVFPTQRFRPPGCLPFMYVCIFLFTQASLKKEIRNLEHVFKFALVFPHPTCSSPAVLHLFARHTHKGDRT